MKFKAFYTAVTALSLVAAPTMATAAAPVATPLTQPASETVEGDNAAIARGTSFIVLALALIAIGLGIAAAVSGNSRPNSP